MTVSDFIEMLKNYDGDMPILTPALGVPTVQSVLGKVVIRDIEGEQLALQPIRQPNTTH